MTTRLSLVLGGLLTFCLGSGCGTLSRMQFAVVPPKPPLGMKATLLEGDQERVVELLRRTASRLHLTDRSSVSMVPNTLAYYQGTNSDNPFKLIAWKQDNRILIDFMHTSEGLGESVEFRQARERLFEELRGAFGERLQIVPLQRQASPSAPPGA